MHIVGDSISNMEKIDNCINNKKPIIVLYKTNWCGFCTSFKPVWDLFAKKTKINTAVIDIDTMNSLPRYNPKHTTSSFPTIRLFNNNKVVIFEDERSVETLGKFVNKHVRSKPVVKASAASKAKKPAAKKEMPKKAAKKKVTPRKTSQK